MSSARSSPRVTSGESYLVTSPDTDSVATVVLPALNLNLLGLQVKTGEIIVNVSAAAGDGKLLGNLLTTASNLINLQEASDALNRVLSTTVGLLNSSDLGINLGGGSFDARPETTTDVPQLSMTEPVPQPGVPTRTRTPTPTGHPIPTATAPPSESWAVYLGGGVTGSSSPVT